MFLVDCIFNFLKIIRKSSPRYSADYEVHEMNAVVDDIERVLNKIAQQLKQVNLYILLHMLINYN